MNEAKQFHSNALIKFPVSTKQSLYSNQVDSESNAKEQHSKHKTGMNMHSDDKPVMKVVYNESNQQSTQIHQAGHYLYPQLHSTLLDHTKMSQGLKKNNIKGNLKLKHQQITQKEQKIKESELMFKTLQSFSDSTMDPHTLIYSNKVHKIKASGEAKDKQKLDQMEKELHKESILNKWKGSGLEEEIFQEYMVSTKRPEPVSERNLDIPETRVLPQSKKTSLTQPNESLYPKSATFVTVDGAIHYEQPLSLVNSGLSAYDSFKQSNYHNKIQSLSRFFALKSSAKQNAQFTSLEKRQVNDVKVYQTSRNQLNIIPTEPSKKATFIKSQNLSVFGQKSESMQRSIPMVKEWFESLDLQDRTMCLTTIDAQIVSHLKQMQLQLLKVGKQQQAKFRMNSSLAQVNNNQGKNQQDNTKIEYTFNLCNNQAHLSNPQKALAEQQLLQYVRITDALEMHDTLTISEDLVKQPHRFYELGVIIVGSNYLKAPHEVRWLKEENQSQYEFESCAPLWLNMHEPNSLASWILYFLERSLFIQFQMNVHLNYLDCKDSKNQSIIIGTDNKNIVLKDELKPFWRNYCNSIQEHKQSADEFLAMVKSKAITMFDVTTEAEQAQVSHLHGGLTLHNNDATTQDKHLSHLIDKFIDKLNQFIQNQDTQNSPQLELDKLCMDTLKETCQMNNPNEPQKISQDLFIASLTKSQITTSSKASQTQLAIQELNIVMKLERTLVEIFRDKITQDLKSNFTSTNKKVQKRKIKKLKQREQQLEKEREEQRLKQQREHLMTEKSKNVIKIQNSQAINMLIGNFDKPQISSDQDLMSSMNSKLINQTDAIKEKKNTKINKKKNKGKNIHQHKQSLSLETQAQEQISKMSDISGALTFNPPFEKSSREGTAQTKSTSKESKTITHKLPSNVQIKAEQATSNEEVINIYHDYLPNPKLGNHQLRNTQWQRNQYGLNEMVNELVSESSHHSGIQNHEFNVIQVKVSQNKLVTEFDDILSHQSDVSQGNKISSKSSLASNKQIIQFKKRQNQKIIPREAISNSDESSEPNSELDLLPDLHTTSLQPKDNDSSDFEQDNDESLDEEDQSSMAASQNEGRNPSHNHPPPIQKQQNNNIQTKKSAKKSIKSAYLKRISQNNQINLNSAAQKGEQSNIIEPEIIKHRWKKIANISPVTIQYISMTQLVTTEWKESKNNKKTKKQRKLDRQDKFGQDHSNIEPRTIEIIKPQVMTCNGPQFEIIKPLPIKSVKQGSGSNQIPNIGQSSMKKQQQTSENRMHLLSTKTQPESLNSHTPIVNTKTTVQHVLDVRQINDLQEAKLKKKDHIDAMLKQQMHKDNQSPQKEPTQITKSKKLAKSDQSANKKYVIDTKNSQKETQIEDTTKKNKHQIAEKQTNSNVYNQPSKTKALKTQYLKKTKISDQNQMERMSSMEAAKIISSGFEYKAKSNQTQPTQVQIKHNTKDSNQLQPKQEVKSVSQKQQKLTNHTEKHNNSASKIKITDLNIESKEFIVPKKQTEGQAKNNLSDNDATETKEAPKKKKKAKKRSNKNENKSQALQNNFMIDPLIGQQLLNMSYDQSYLDQSGLNPIRSIFMENPQVQDLLQTLNDQVIAQQHKQLEQIKLKQQEEVETQLLEDCQPCPEIDSDRYEMFFDDLEHQMKNKIKEIDQLKDSVRKERQGFIQIMETIVKQTFQNKYGNGFVGIKIFGSMATELAIETSDVDLVVTGINQASQSYSGYRNEYQSKNSLLKMMQKLHDNLDSLKDEKKIHKIKYIQTATVPIIKLVVDLQMINEWQTETTLQQIRQEQEQEKTNQEINLKQMGLVKKVIDQRVRFLKVDISIDESSESFQKFEYNQYNHRSHSGIETIYHIQELVKERKDLRPIVMIIKKIFDQTFLSMPYCGGISSFSLVLMVSAYLKRFDSQKLQSLSTNLSGFFHFYGVGFKPHLFYLNGDQIQVCEDTKSRPFTDPFIVLDPLDPSNNISHSSFRIRDIQRALVKAFKIINTSCEQYQRQTKEQLIHQDSSFTPKRVLERLMSEIKEEYLYTQVYNDDI